VQVKPENVDTVLTIAREEVAKLARSPVDAEEFARAKNPGVAALERDQKSINYWVAGLVGWTTHPELIELHRHRLERMKSITPENVREAVATYVMDEGDWSMVVLPEKGGK
jgi:zinc protease